MMSHARAPALKFYVQAWKPKPYNTQLSQFYTYVGYMSLNNGCELNHTKPSHLP